MDLVCEIEGPTSTLGNGTISFNGGLEIPDHVLLVGGMRYDFGGGERHFDSLEPIPCLTGSAEYALTSIPWFVY